MNWKRIIAIVVIIAALAVVFFKLRSNKQVAVNKVYHYDKEKPVMVRADTVRMRTITDQGAYTGTFEPYKETKISADAQGKINAVLVDVGSYVSKGQTLVQLDNSLLKLQVQAVDVQIGGLEDDVRRYSILTEADAIQGVQLEKAKLGLKAARVQKATLLEQISKTSVRAPFSGVVTAKLNEVGGYAAPGIPLLQITDIGYLRFTVNVPENDLHLFQMNKSYHVSVDVIPDISLLGKVVLIGSKANMGNSFPVQFQVANSRSLAIKSGMFGKVNLSGTIPLQGIAVPASAVIEDAGRAQVYLIRNGKASLQAVTTSKNIGNEVVIAKGLDEGDIIVTSGFINLFENANVTIK
jgi:RND family efflux transporter MFP subunit